MTKNRLEFDRKEIDNNEPLRWNLTDTSQRRTLLGEYDRNITKRGNNERPFIQAL